LKKFLHTLHAYGQLNAITDSHWNINQGAGYQIEKNQRGYCSGQIQPVTRGNKSCERYSGQQTWKKIKTCNKTRAQYSAQTQHFNFCGSFFLDAIFEKILPSVELQHLDVVKALIGLCHSFIFSLHHTLLNSLFADSESEVDHKCHSEHSQTRHKTPSKVVK